MAAVTSNIRVLILSADVAGGHDAAARALADDIALRYPASRVDIANGLRLAGPVLHHLVRDGYKLQITYASSTYALLFRIISFTLVTRCIRWMLAHLYGRKFCRAVREFDADVIVSTYPLVTALLGKGRLTGTITTPVAAVITDVHPHILCLAPGIDMHFVAVPGDVQRVALCDHSARVTAARPPLREGFLRPPNTREARNAFGFPSEGDVILVSGGAWCVGHVDDVVSQLVEQTDAFVVVACGTNDRLREELQKRYCASRVRALPFCQDMPHLFAACNALVHTGAGLTCLEAIVSSLPVVLYNVLPGHGVRSAAALVDDHMVRWAHTRADLIAAVDDVSRESLKASKRRRYAEALLALDPIADGVVALQNQVEPVPRRPALVARSALATLMLLVLVMVRTPVGAAYSDLAKATHVVKQKIDVDAPFGNRELCAPQRSRSSTQWHARNC